MLFRLPIFILGCLHLNLHCATGQSFNSPVVAPTASGNEYIGNPVASPFSPPANGGMKEGYILSTITTEDSYPQGLARDNISGRIFISEFFGHFIRTVDPNSGSVAIFAGTLNQPGFSGDGGKATAAQLFQPYGVAISLQTNKLFIADSMNHRIRTVGLLDNEISTFYSSDLSFPRGVTVDTKEEYLYIVDTMHNRILKVLISNPSVMAIFAGVTYFDSDYQGVYFDGDNGVATNAHMKYPSQIDFDSAGNAYIADTDNNRVRKVDQEGIITTVCGPKGIHHLFSVVVDHQDNLILTDTYGHAIKHFDVSTRVLTTIAGTSACGMDPDDPYIDATHRAICNPAALLMLPGGEILVADSINARTFKLSPKVWLTSSSPVLQPLAMPSSSSPIGTGKKLPAPYAVHEVSEGRTLTTVRFYSKNHCEKSIYNDETVLICRQ